jgi:hypothetical protein
LIKNPLFLSISQVNPIARPLATRRLAKKLYKLVRKAAKVKASAPPPPTPNGGLAGPRVDTPMKQGLADVMRAFRRNQSGLVIMAGMHTRISSN